MIDFHSHILPGIDDGSKTVSMSLQMLAELKRQGVDTVCATSHFYATQRSPQRFLERRQEAYEKLCANLPEGAPHILLGAEVLYFPGISRMEELPSLCLEGTNLLLLEMPFEAWSGYMVREVNELAKTGRFTILMAHIERYYFQQAVSVWDGFLEDGILMQSNADFFLPFGTRRKALRLLKEGRIHLLGTDCPDTKTVLSSFRMFFAYGGSFIALFCWEPLCNALGGYGTPAGWQHAMIVIAGLCLVLFLLSFAMTREKLHTESTSSIASDFGSLVRNAPWWILIGAALCSNLFNTVRGSTVAYFFNDVIGPDVHLNLGKWGFLFYAGLFLSIGEVCNMLGVAMTTPIAKALGKKTTYMLSFAALIVLSIAFFFVPKTGYWWMIVLQVVISIFTGIISPLVWSMYADVSDFAENRDGTASTGLIFSSASMAQKFGGAFGGYAVMALLGAFGYNTAAGAVQTAEAVKGLWILMSWVPAAVAALAIVIVFFYPLTKSRMEKIQEELAVKRNLK